MEMKFRSFTQESGVRSQESAGKEKNSAANGVNSTAWSFRTAPTVYTAKNLKDIA